MKILAFGGSSSSTSINKQLAAYAASLFEGGEVNLIDLNHFELPLFSVDKEKLLGAPPAARKFIDAIEEADLLVLSVAEHNAGLTAAFKNIYDWASRQKKSVFSDKPILLLSTSPGRYGGKNALDAARISLPNYGGDIRATFSLPSFNHNFDVETGKISNPELDIELREIVKKFDYSPKIQNPDQ